MSGDDRSHGYDGIADQFMSARSSTGTDLVRHWAKTLAPGAAVLDIGAGHGEPLTKVLIDDGLNVSAIDASPRLVEAFRQRFPGVEIACEPVEESRFHDKNFDAVLAVGLIFLLPADAQRALIDRVAQVLIPGGRFLFSAPRETGSWRDILTEQTSISLGEAEYLKCLEAAGLVFHSHHTDEGGSHYYEVQKPTR